MQVRRLDDGDLAAARALGAEAFGSRPSAPTAPPPERTPPGRHPWGVFDGERLVAKLQAHEYESWWRGVRLPTCGIAGVAVAAEYRGRGLLRELFAVALDEARERGEVISTLFPTAPGIYRSLGYELIASYDTVSIPTAELGRLAASHGVVTRRAEADDLPAVHAVYEAWASAQNGPLTRTGPLFTGSATGEAALPDDVEITLALDPAGAPVGVVVWERTDGYGPQGVLRVHDLLATSADGYRALWRLAASFASVTGTVRLSTSGADPARLVLPGMTWDVVGRHPYCLRVLDAPAVLEALAPAADVAGVALQVHGDRLGLVDGPRAVGTTDSSTAPLPISVQGLALLVSGAQSTGNLTLLGELAGADRAGLERLDAAFGGRQVHIRDYF